jgi:hypothetical protein
MKQESLEVNSDSDSTCRSENDSAESESSKKEIWEEAEQDEEVADARNTIHVITKNFLKTLIELYHSTHHNILPLMT